MAKTKPGVGRLLTAMKRMIVEVNDQEICRRLEILQNSEKDDLAPSLMKRLLEDPAGFDAREVPEPYTQYVKHYLYMIKRIERERERASSDNADDQLTRKKRKKTASRKKKSASAGS